VGNGMMRHEPVPVISDVPIHHKRPAFAFFLCVPSSPIFGIILPRSGVKATRMGVWGPGLLVDPPEGPSLVHWKCGSGISMIFIRVQKSA
jgi:hypothetical protein